MVKLLMTWNIRPGKEQEYIEFLTQEFAPTILRLGIQPTDAWLTIYGEGPQVHAGGMANDLETMERVLAGKDWKKLEAKLLSLVDDYKRKIVVASNGFQI
ncbi:MAG: hypothetical protein ACUVX9_11410 [Anaerolineae bacterium]